MVKDRYPLATKFGAVSIQVNTANAVYVSGGVRVNGVDLTMGCNMGLYDGEWGLYRERGATSGTWSYLRLRNEAGKDASDNAREKVLAELTKVVGEWIKANPEAVAARERQRKEEEIESLQHKLDLVLVEADTIRARISELKGQL